jgi:hypothetical protein
MIIECDDEMREYINIECFKSDSMVAVNSDLNGNQNAPKAIKQK